MSGPVSQCRHNYHSETEAAVNKQINLELYASYVYLSMVSLPVSESSQVLVHRVMVDRFVNLLDEEKR